MKTNVITLEKLPLLKDEKRVSINFIFSICIYVIIGALSMIMQNKIKIKVQTSGLSDIVTS